MTYPLRQRTFHEFLYYLLNVGLHCCGTRAVKHYRRQLIKEYHQRGVCNESETENPSCVKWSSLTFVRPFLPSLYLVCCLFLSDCVCQSVSLQNHTGIFQNAHVEGFFLKKHTLKTSHNTHKHGNIFLEYRKTLECKKGTLTSQRWNIRPISSSAYLCAHLP